MRHNGERLARLRDESYPDRLDTRTHTRRLVEKLEFSSWKALAKSLFCLSLALAVGFFPQYEGLSEAGHRALFILVFAAGLWISEAIPAFSVAILVIALEIALLGRPGGVFAESSSDWQVFVSPWSSPLLWLFFGGFVLASAAHRTHLDRWLASNVIAWFGNRPGMVLAGVMSITFVFSMFMSNTATAAMMMAVMAPVFVTLRGGDPFIKALILGVPFAANIGGMGTLIGTPPNAIAAGALTSSGSGSGGVSFVHWMLAGVPVAVVLLVIVFVYLKIRYPCRSGILDLSALKVERDEDLPPAPLWQRLLVMSTFGITILLWMTQPLHGLPTAVVSFVPITVFSVSGVFRSQEMRSLSWDVLMLLAGGLSLGVAMEKTGLARWLVGLLPMSKLGVTLATLLISYAVLIISNFVSNTSAASIVVPIGLSIGASMGMAAPVVVSIALSSSAAMCLPISTPPNAIAFSMQKVHTTDFLVGGLLIGGIAPLLVVLWCGVIF